jgi:hypothetical protein
MSLSGISPGSPPQLGTEGESASQALELPVLKLGLLDPHPGTRAPGLKGLKTSTVYLADCVLATSQALL